MKRMFNGTCGKCNQSKPCCAVVAVRGCNAWGDRETRVETLCGDCRKTCRGLYLLHPNHK